MNIVESVYSELKKLGFEDKDQINFNEIRNKDGIYLYRVKHNEKFYVLKYFMNDEYLREIKYYSILKELNIPTIKVYGHTNRSLLLEDIDKSEKYRLGVEEDLSDVEVAKALAKWYIKLHNEGQKYIQNNSIKFYRELDSITKENIEMIKNKSNTSDNKVWDLIINNLELILDEIKSFGETFTYNDFYWTNLIVSKDKKEAMMFDYNLLGAGFRYNDIRNVCSSLSEEAGKKFIKEYGEFHEDEKVFDEGMVTLFGLISAYRKAEFPSWGQECLDDINNGNLEKCFRRMVELCL